MHRFSRFHRRGLLPAAIALFCLASGTPTARAALVSEERLERESDRVFKQMKARIRLSRDAAARDYVECVARTIIAELDEPYRSMDWEIELFEHNSANAFAMPGGKIGVFTGILGVARDQHSLAAVIGHEVAHVTARHALKRARKKSRNQLLVVAAASAIGGGRATADALSLGTEIGLNLPYDRKQERQADDEGLTLMARAGFDPRASITLWKRMSKQGQPAPPEFLSTHPSSDDRLDGLIGRLVPALIAYNEAHEHNRVPRCE